MSTYKKLENCKAELRVSVEKQVWLKAQEKAFDKLSKNITVKGFRKGQAPKNLVKKQLNSHEVLSEALSLVAQEQFIKAVEEHDVKIVARPELKVEKINEDELELLFDIMVSPDVELKQYKGFGYKLPEIYVSEDELNSEIENLRNRYANLELKEEGSVEEGDTAIINYEGFKDGVAFEGGKGENHPLQIGSHTFIPGFEEAIIGMKPDEEKDVELTFPEDYHAQDLKGAKVVFKVKVNEIKTKVLPQIDEEFFENLKIDGVNSKESLEAHLRQQLLERKKADETNKKDEEMLEKLIEANPIQLPEVMVENETKELVNEFAQRLSYQGLSLDKYLEMLKLTKEKLFEQYRDSAVKRVKMRLLISAVADKEKIVAKQEDVEKEYEKYTEMYKLPLEEVKKYIPEADLKEEIKFRKTFDFIREN